MQVSFGSRVNLGAYLVTEFPAPVGPVVIEGQQELETLLPVSKLTGRRENVLTLLEMQFSKDSRLLNALLQELPVVQSDPNIADEDRFSVLASRLATGTMYEQDALTSQLSKVADVLFPQQNKEAEKIVFDAAKDVGLDPSTSSSE